LSQRHEKGASLPLIVIHASGGDDEAADLAREHSTLFGTEEGEKIRLYLQNGGVVNFENLFRYLHSLIHAEGEDAAEPVAMPHEGLYHPDYSSHDDFEGYLASHVDPLKPTVGIWFYQNYYVDADLASYDWLIREIESRGGNVIAVFHHRFRDAMRGNRGSDYVADYYFHDADGKSRIDVLINPMLFALSMASADYRTILPGLDVPFLQAFSTFQNQAEWRASIQGLGTMEVSYNAAQPEFDGALMTVPFFNEGNAGALIRLRGLNCDALCQLRSVPENWLRWLFAGPLFAGNATQKKNCHHLSSLSTPKRPDRMCIRSRQFCQHQASAAANG